MSLEEIDFEDFIEEVKFQLTEYEGLGEDVILNWEAKVRDWIMKNENRKRWIVKSASDIKIFIKDDDDMFEVARKFHKAYKSGKIETYWKTFALM